MFEITPSPEFSAWFEALAEPLAEEVACALDLVAGAIGALSPARVSRALLWFDGLGDSHSAAEAESLLPLLQGRSLAFEGFDAMRELMLWHREIVRCLESSAFRERLAELSPQGAALALAAVGRVQALLRAARVQVGLETAAKAAPALPPSARRILQTLSVHEEQVLRARFGIGAPERQLTTDLSQAFRETLQLVGLDPGRLVNSDSGLRELTVSNTTPKLRVLFGIDAPAGRLVALLGEPLDRQYYGDSVRFAEQRWHEYCAQAPAEVQESR